MLSVFGRARRGSNIGLLLLQRFSVGFAVEYSSCFISVFNFDLYVCCFHADEQKSRTRTEQLLMYVYELQLDLGRGLLERETGLSP